MNIKLTVSVICLLLALGHSNINKRSLQDHVSHPKPHSRQNIAQDGNKELSFEDPFKKGHSNEKKRGSSQRFPTPKQADEIWQVYKPFEYGTSEDKEDNQVQNQQYSENFNELLAWGMLAGTMFLCFVLAKTCMRKRGKREMRRVRQNQTLMRQIQPTRPVQQQVYFHGNQPAQQKSQGELLDDEIHSYEIELNKLKDQRQLMLKQQFTRKKIEEERRQIEMTNLQRNKGLQEQRRSMQPTYGPAFYGQQNQVLVQRPNHMFQQPFQAKGIEPIPRKRSNSFKTEASQQPIVQGQNKYRKWIPIGKPLRQDNDSSFASEYPQV